MMWRDIPLEMRGVAVEVRSALQDVLEPQGMCIFLRCVAAEISALQQFERQPQV
jgi:hypothetical protein